MTQRIDLITGGIGGIGTAICQLIASDAMRVIAAHHPVEDEAAGAEHDSAGLLLVCVTRR